MVKKSKKFNYSKNLKKQWKKLKDKKNPSVKTEQLKEFWDPRKTMQQNYAELGLSLDPNTTLKIPKAKDMLIPEVMQVERAKLLGECMDDDEQIDDESETEAIKQLEKLSKTPQEKKYNLNENDVLFCIYMMEKYGNNYEKMVKDYKNYYQETAAQISKKIKLFRNMKPQYEKYLNEKKDGKNFLKELDEEY